MFSCLFVSDTLHSPHMFNHMYPAIGMSNSPTQTSLDGTPSIFPGKKFIKTLKKFYIALGLMKKNMNHVKLFSFLWIPFSFFQNILITKVFNFSFKYWVMYQKLFNSLLKILKFFIQKYSILYQKISNFYFKIRFFLLSEKTDWVDGLRTVAGYYQK